MIFHRRVLPSGNRVHPWIRFPISTHLMEFCKTLILRAIPLLTQAGQSSLIRTRRRSRDGSGQHILFSRGPALRLPRLAP